MDYAAIKKPRCGVIYGDLYYLIRSSLYNEVTEDIHQTCLISGSELFLSNWSIPGMLIATFVIARNSAYATAILCSKVGLLETNI